MMNQFPYIKIEDINNWVQPVKIYSNVDPRWHSYWSEQIRRCIEGFWAFDNGGWRYMPSSLYFTVMFTTLVHTDEKENTRRVIRPILNDIFWHYNLMSLVSKGFSGFREDNVKTCDSRIFTYNAKKHNTEKYLDLFTTSGKFKEYVEPMEYVSMLHKEAYATPLYNNPTNGYIILGARGSGKTYHMALGEVLHAFCTDDLKYYTQENIRSRPKITCLIGSGDVTKSSNLCEKVSAAMNEMAINPLVGVYGEPGERDYCPCPLYRNTIGNLDPSNRSDPYRHEYKLDIGGATVTKGTGSSIHHVVYSVNKRDGKGGQASAGGRYNVVVTDEIGLTELLLEAHRSNTATTRIGGRPFGRLVYAGTSENIVQIQPAKEMFTHPKDYGLISFPDVWERTGNIGFFLPAYLTDFNFKDKHGNTDIEAAKEHFNSIREEKALASNPDILRGEKLNYPLIPSEMWLGTKAKILPYEEAADREKDLMKNHLYEKIGIPVTLSWNSQFPNGVKHEVNFAAKPIFNYPVRVDTDNVEGSIQIYSFPEEENGIVPNDKYLAICDTYVSEALDAGGSLGVTFVVLHPKYWHKIPPTGPIVASYIGKHASGLDGHLENQEKLLAFYGNPVSGLWIEKNRIERYRDHYIKKKKHWLLAPTPTSFLSKSAYQRIATEYGIPLSSKVTKLQWLDMLHDLLLEKINVMGTEKCFIETIPCIYTIREIMAYDIDNGNFDAVSALLLLPVVIKELEYGLTEELKAKNNKNPLSWLANNQRIFNNKLNYA